MQKWPLIAAESSLADDRETMEEKMILAIDIGNTNIVVGCIDSKQTYFIERLSTVRTKTELEYAVDLKTVLDLYHIKRIDIEGCIISSVVPQITNAVKLAAEKVLKKEYPEQILGKYKDEVNKMVELSGIEPLTSCVQSRRSPS